MKNEKPPTKYRIISNGLKFVIQGEYTKSFLFWSWSKWHDLGKNIGMYFIPKEYDSLKEAQDTMEYFIASDAKEHKWIPIK